LRQFASNQVQYSTRRCDNCSGSVGDRRFFQGSLFLVRRTLSKNKTMMSSFWVTLLVVVAVMAVSYGQATPEQFHIALAGSNGMSISWFTAISTEKSECRYGTTVESLGGVATGTQRAYHQDYGFHHSTELQGLTPGTKYFYSCGDGVSMSQTFSFTSAPSADDTSKPLSMVIFGDMVSSKTNVFTILICLLS
jgi:hypothetical protein